MTATIRCRPGTVTACHRRWPGGVAPRVCSALVTRSPLSAPLANNHISARLLGECRPLGLVRAALAGRCRPVMASAAPPPRPARRGDQRRGNAGGPAWTVTCYVHGRPRTGWTGRLRAPRCALRDPGTRHERRETQVTRRATRGAASAARVTSFSECASDETRCECCE